MTSVRAPVLLGVVVAAVAAACTVGSGSGDVSGPVYIANCAGYSGASRADPITFDLNPQFFAAEGVEDVREGDKINRLALRIQRNPGNIENSDVLHVNIVNSREVARCLRGHVELSLQGKLSPDYDANVCYWPSPEGPPRMRIGHNDYVRAALTPFGSCRSKANNQPLNVVATAIGCVGEKANMPCPAQDPAKWPSWIEFDRFGSVKPGMGSPDQRAEIPKSFKVEYDERIIVSRFHLTLEDQRIVQPRVTPSPLEPQITGVLDGWFEFDFERGRAVQTFP